MKKFPLIIHKVHPILRTEKPIRFVSLCKRVNFFVKMETPDKPATCKKCLKEFEKLSRARVNELEEFP